MEGFQPFGKYLLLQKLAVGGMAEIFLAKQTGLAGFEKLVVIKRILPEHARDAEFVKMFLDEARVAASMSHPNVVQIFDLGEVDKTLYIAMEYIAGQDLRHVIRKSFSSGVFPEADLLVRMICGACDGLQYAHTLKDNRGQPLNLVHRDVTPSNLLVAYDGMTKVLDFGVAKAESQLAKTTGGRLKGKFSYMAPEQIENDVTLDARVDVWALGVTLHEALTGGRLFRADNELAMLKLILDEPIEPPSRRRDDLPKDLDGIVMKALERDRNRRYPSARALQQDLERWLRSRPDGGAQLENVADFMQRLFLEEFEAQRQLVAEAPNASPEELAKQLQSLTSGLSTSSDSIWSSGSGPQPPQVQPQSPSGVDREARTAVRPPPIGANAPAQNVSAPPMPSALPAQAYVSPAAPPKPPAKKLNSVVIGGGAALLIGVVAAAVMFTRKPEAPAPAAPVAKVPAAEMPAPLPTGNILVRTDPPGALVYVDGRMQPEKTPTAVSEIPFGKRVLKFELAGYQDREQTVVLTKENPSEVVALTLQKAQKAPGTIVVETTPEGATVFLDGVRQPLPSPTRIAQIPAGAPHTVLVEKEGYELTTANVVLEPGEEKTLPFALVAKPASKGGPKKPVAFGKLSLTSEPPMEAFLSGKSLGKTPLDGVQVPAGAVTVNLVAEGMGLTYPVALEVKANEKVSRAVTLAKGKLAADVQPWADVYIGNQKLGTTPLAPREVYEGTYTMRLVNNEIGALKTLNVTVKPGQTAVVRENLQ